MGASPEQPAKNRAFLALCVALACGYAALILLPIAALLARSLGISWLHVLRLPFVREALLLSLATATLATVICVLLGLPLAYLLAFREFPGKRVLDVLIDLPLILPPAVAGLALLMAFGRRGLLGPVLERAGLHVALTTSAVVLAQIFVAGPIFVRIARLGLAAVDPALVAAARTLGADEAGTFWRVVLPLAARSVAGGLVFTWARSLGEFGATLMFAGSLPGVTQTMPLAIFASMQSDVESGIALSAILLVLSGLLLGLARYSLKGEAVAWSR